MTVQFLTPTRMLQGAPYHHVAVATGATQVHVAGQVGQPGNDPVVPDDLAAQVAQSLRNTATGLSAASATFADVVRLTFYVTRWTPDKIEAFMEGVNLVAEEIGLPLPMPPSSLIGVEALYAPDVLVEVEATAVLP